MTTGNSLSNYGQQGHFRAIFQPENHISRTHILSLFLSLSNSLFLSFSLWSAFVRDTRSPRVERAPDRD